MSETVTDEELIREAESLRDRAIQATVPADLPLLGNDLRALVFERTREPDPPGLLAHVMGHGPESQHTGSGIENILNETHLRYGVAGEIVEYGNGMWHYRWSERK